MTHYYAYTDDLNLLTFTAQSPTGSRLWRDAPEGSYLLLYPHWYRTDARRALSFVGKTQASACRASIVPVTTWREELETLIDGELSPALRSYEARLPVVILFDPVLVSEVAKSATSCFPPCSYVLIDPFLYRTDRQARLRQVVGAWTLGPHPTPQEFSALLERLTGIKPEQISSVVLSPSHVGAIAKGMPQKSSGRP
ncbi:MAG TPA: hypothetical protein VKV37_10330 [Ktedonobacteraceae bacterium]|nr:hypothetical protein [Ktedonobacteraceae bacterium]